MADTLPPYLADNLDSNQILQDMIANVPSDLDTSEGGFIYDSLSPASIEMALAALWAQQVLQYGFAQTTYGAYLDMRGEEHGIPRIQADFSKGTVTLGGASGTPIPTGYNVSTQSTSSSPAVIYTTNAAVTIGSGGTVDVGVTAQTAGSSGNVPAGSITLLGDPITGLSSVTNAAATTGGIDAETDPPYLARYLQKVQNPSTGGNDADYQAWALAVSGVGAVSVVPVRDGAGTVSIAVLDTNKQPASQTLVSSVQNVIAPPWDDSVEAETMTLSGYGTSIDTTTTDASGGSSVKMVYNASGNGVVTDSLNSVLQEPGIWKANVTVKVDATTDATNTLLQIGVWDTSSNAWCQTSPSSGVNSVSTYKASNLTITFAVYTVEFYWNGTDNIELQVTRETTNTTDTVWVDKAEYVSAFSQDTGNGKAPIGARVTVEAGTTVNVNVAAALTIETGFDRATVETAVENNIKAYLQSIAFVKPSPDSTVNTSVAYAKVGDSIINTPGIGDYSNLTVNGGTGNVPVGIQQVGVLGTVTWS